MENKNKWIISFFSILLGLFVGAITLKLANISPLEAFSVMFHGMIDRPHYMAFIIIRSTTLILTGLSVAFAFRTGLFNIGAEGQFIIGSLACAMVGVKFNFSPWIQIPLCIFVAMLASGLYGGFAGFIKARFGVHEVIATIMLNWIALYLSNFVITTETFLRPNTESTEFVGNNSSIVLFENFKSSPNGLAFLEQHSFLNEFLRPSVNAGIFFAMFSSMIIWFLLNKTTFGFKLKAVGFNSEAARFAGINVKKKLTLSMFIAGAISGLAGCLHVLGVSKNVAILAAHEGHGFDGIAVSLMASSHPIGVLFSGLFLGAIKYAGQKLQSTLDTPSEIISIMIGSIIFFMAIPNLIETIFSKIKRSKS
jgi:ABC-type uncharacterized transport system permease subunit